MPTILTYHGPYGSYNVFLEKRFYEGGRIAIRAHIPDEGPAFTATVNLPEHKIERDEAFIKDYAENQGVLAFLRENGIVTELIRHVRSGYVTIPLCKINLKRLEELL